MLSLRIKYTPEPQNYPLKKNLHRSPRLFKSKWKHSFFFFFFIKLFVDKNKECLIFIGENIVSIGIKTSFLKIALRRKESQTKILVIRLEI